jgi:DNA polymerase III delta subunit
VPKKPFTEGSVPPFADAPAAILITGDVEFFVEEAVTRAREALGDADTEVLVFDDDAPAEAVSDALLNRSLFSPRRLVQLDVSRVVGTDKPADLLDAAIEAWEKGTPAGRREAFRAARALLAALDLPSSGSPDENAEAAARKTRRKDEAPLLAEILKELPPESAGAGAVLKAALRAVLAREHNDGTVALLTAVKPPSGVDLIKEIEKKGLILEASVGDEPEPALRRLANARAKEREVVLEPAAVERLLKRTDSKAASFASELEKLLEWAGKGGRIRAADVDTNVQDEASEDIYEFFEAIGRREAKDALARLERLFEEGREVSAGDLAVETDRDWPAKFLGMLTAEVRRMLLIRSRLDESGGPGGFDAQMSYSTFQARLLPRLMAPATPFGRSPFETAQGRPVHPFALYRAAQRSSRYTAPQLARALARAAEVDVKLKDSAPILETLTAYVGELIAGT